MSLEGKKTIFKLEVKEWLFHSIYKLLEEDYEDFEEKGYEHPPFRNSIFILFGIFAYIDKMELYRGNGKKSSNNRLVGGVKRIFTNLANKEENEIRDILRKSRHNLMHQAIIGDNILVNLGFGDVGFDEAIDIVNKDGKQEIRIHPIKAYDTIIKDFEEYLNNIDSDDDLKDKFEIFFDKVYKYEIDIIKSDS